MSVEGVGQLRSGDTENEWRADAGDGVGVGDVDGRAYFGVSLRGVRVGGSA